MIKPITCSFIEYIMNSDNKNIGDSALESAKFHYDLSNKHSLDRYIVSISDIQEHAFKLHEKPTFKTISRREKSKRKYDSYFDYYYRNHIDDLARISNTVIHENSQNIINMIKNTNDDRVFFTYKHSKNIGYVNTTEDNIKTKYMLIVLGVDRDTSHVYFASAYPVLKEDF